MTFAYMNKKEIFSIEIFRDPKSTGNFINQRIPVVNFKLQGLVDVTDYTFSNFKFEVINKHNCYMYTKKPNSNIYVKEGDDIERTDLDMRRVWMVSIENSTNFVPPSKRRIIEENLSKGRIIINGINKISYIDSWKDNIPDDLVKDLYDPKPLRSQSNEVVVRSPTDNTVMLTYSILTNRSWLASQQADDRQKAFTKFYSYELYENAYVAENFAVLFTAQKYKRVIFFGANGTMQIDLDALTQDVRGYLGADAIWASQDEIRVFYRNIEFSWNTKSFVFDSLSMQVEPFKKAINIMSHEYLEKVVMLDMDCKPILGYHIAWKQNINLWGYLVWASYALLFVFSVLVLVVGVMRQKKHKRVSFANFAF